MMRLSTIFWVLLVTIAGATLFTISYSVKEKQEHLAQVKNDISKTRDEVRVLTAEWSYLNQPERLEKLMRRYTALQPTKHQQIVAFADVPYANDATPDLMPAASVLAAAPTMKPILASTKAALVATR